jgi:hypothetical protein
MIHFQPRCLHVLVNAARQYTTRVPWPTMRWIQSFCVFLFRRNYAVPSSLGSTSMPMLGVACPQHEHAASGCIVRVMSAGMTLRLLTFCRAVRLL